jgi:gamma-glutamyltranspeptidase/glutathione hydrolase
MRNIPATSIKLVLCALVLAACTPSAGVIDKGEPATPQAAVAMPATHARAVAAAVLRNGGNAVDAAVAAAFTLAVVQPEAGNIGGGGFMTIFMDGEARFLDYRETAPAAASRNMFLGPDGKPDADESLVGHRASGVPGTVAGLWAAHQRYGTRTWAELVAPAVDLARNGFTVYPALAQYAREALTDLAGTNFAAHFAALTTTRRFRQPDLADTLQRIAENGADEFYRGRTARLLAAEMARGGGLITRADLAGYRAIWRDPIDFRWRDYRVLTAPPPSSGGVAIAQLLKMYEARGGDFADLGHNSAAYVHLNAELAKRVFADRAVYLGDPDFVSVPVDSLIDDDYLRARASEANPAQITRPRPVPVIAEHNDTTHFSIVDGAGNAIANTYTINTSFGSGVVVTGAGFLMNNEMDDFAVAPNSPNYFGLVGSEANAIAPGKRMLSSMSPTIALRDGKVALVVGAMGGSAIITSVYQVMLNLEAFGMEAPEALAATRVHHQFPPDDLITYDPSGALPTEAVAGLEALGYRVEPHSWAFGNVQLIWRNREGVLQAASDERFSGASEVLRTPPP